MLCLDLLILLHVGFAFFDYSLRTQRPNYNIDWARMVDIFKGSAEVSVVAPTTQNTPAGNLK